MEKTAVAAAVTMENVPSRDRQQALYQMCSDSGWNVRRREKVGAQWRNRSLDTIGAELKDAVLMEARRLLKQRGEEELARQDAKAAKTLVSQGTVTSKGLDQATLAAWTGLANVLLNLDETITRECAR